MISYSLTRPGPISYALSRPANILSVTRTSIVRAVTLQRTTVHVQIGQSAEQILTAAQAQVDAHAENHNNPHQTNADQVHALGYPVVVADVSALLGAATGATPKFFICLSDPDYSDGPTFNFWDGADSLIVFAGEKRN